MSMLAIYWASACADFFLTFPFEHSLSISGKGTTLSAAARGTLDSFVAQMLSLHVFGMVSAINDVGVSSLVQTAALIGVGLLYEGSSHRHTVEVRSRVVCYHAHANIIRYCTMRLDADRLG